jgi:hypothetical protein
MRIGSWLAYGEILRNSAIGAARFFNKATMRLHVVRIATTGKDGMIENIGRGLTTGTTGPGLIMTTNKGIMLRVVVRADGVGWPVLVGPRGLREILSSKRYRYLLDQRSRITRLGLIGLKGMV